MVAQWILELPLRATPKMVFIALKSFSGFAEIRPSIRTVALRAGCSRSTVKRCVQILEKKKLVYIKQGKRPDGGDGANIYVLRNPDDKPPVQNEPGVNMNQAQGHSGPGARFNVNPQKNNNKQYIKTHMVDSVSAEAVEEILSGRFSSVDRNWLILQIRRTKRPVKEILRDLDRLCWQYGKANAQEVRAPEALVLKAICEGWAEPDGFVAAEDRKRRSQESESAASQAEAAERAREEAEARHWEAARKQFRNLSEAEQQRYLTRYSWMRHERREAAAIGAYMRKTGI